MKLRLARGWGCKGVVWGWQCRQKETLSRSLSDTSTRLVRPHTCSLCRRGDESVICRETSRSHESEHNGGSSRYETRRSIGCELSQGKAGDAKAAVLYCIEAETAREEAYKRPICRYDLRSFNVCDVRSIIERVSEHRACLATLFRHQAPPASSTTA